MKEMTTMFQPNLSLAGFSRADTTRQWAPGLGFKANQLRQGLQTRWLDAKWSFKQRHFELDADTVTAGIVFGSMLVFATVGMIALMAFVNIGHAQANVVHDEDLYSLSKAVEPASGPEPIITPAMDPHVARTYDDGRSVTVVNESAAVITKDSSNPDIRVMLPSGEVIRVANPVNGAWWKDERVAAYRTYYFDPEREVYVIYDSNTPRPSWKEWENRWDGDGRACPPGTRSC